MWRSVPRQCQRRINDLYETLNTLNTAAVKYIQVIYMHLTANNCILWPDHMYEYLSRCTRSEVEKSSVTLDPTLDEAEGFGGWIGRPFNYHGERE